MFHQLKRMLAGTLRRQLIFGMALVVAATMSLFVWDTTSRQQTALLAQESDQATSLARSVARSSAVWVASRDLSGLQEIVDSFAKFPDLRHVIVLDLGGLILAHSDITRRGQYLADLPKEAEPRILQTTPSFIDVASPVMLADRHIGWVRIGLDGTSSAALITGVIQSGFVHALAAIVFGILLVALASYYLTRRLHEIQRVANAVKLGELELRVDITGDDEAANLARHFNDMLNMLAQRDKDLQESKFRWEFAIEGSGYGVWDWDIRADKAIFSRRWKEMFGYAEADFHLSYKEWQDHIYPYDHAYAMAKMRDYLDGRTSTYVVECRHRCTNGSYKWILSRGMIVNRSEDGKPLRMIGTNSDITERKQGEMKLAAQNTRLEEQAKELAQSRDDAEAANRAKSIFLATMSHELRTPMNGVMGFIDLVLRRATDPKQIDWLNKSKTSARHLLDVIDAILDISKIEAGGLTLEQKNFSLSQVFDETFQMQGEAARAKGLHLSHEISPALPDLLCGDAMRLKQILINFTGNAIKFSETGRITVRAHVVEEKSHSVRLRIEVSDQGIGISREQQSRLFQAFTQADGSMTRKYGGTGLGLIISKRIALLMGGEVGVISAEGQGSTFWVTVELKKKEEQRETDRPQEVEKEDAETVIRQRYFGQRILVVDDEPMNLEIAQLHLEGAGLVVDTADDGAKAIALVQRTAYAAIFMDMQMPNINGLDATRQIRENPSYLHTAIIAMTANAFAEDKAKCIAAGMDAFLIKPFDPETLFATLLRSLDQHKDQLH